jgi:3-methylfumaryl-CoA hydratase
VLWNAVTSAPKVALFRSMRRRRARSAARNGEFADRELRTRPRPGKLRPLERPRSVNRMHDLNHLRDWVGRVRVTEDLVDPARVDRLAATLDLERSPADEGAPLPPLWHWLLFLPSDRQSDIGADGHPRRGGFLPPVELPRRMWAGGRLQFVAPLAMGQRVTRTSTIADISAKSGRTGALVFVRVRHEISNAAGVAVIEEHDIVYRDEPRAGDPPPAPRPAPLEAQFSRSITPDPVLLFRYSALTFNGHRIHYDRSYVTQVEHYPGLVVHGPLIATLLAELLRHSLPQHRLSRFEFKAVRPLFDTAPFDVCGRSDDAGSVALWARDAGGSLAMEATATVE